MSREQSLFLSRDHLPSILGLLVVKSWLTGLGPSVAAAQALAAATVPTHGETQCESMTS